MQNNVLGLSGSVFAFESKAEALKWAIEFTAGWASPDERLVRYEQAQELYDFICRNVANLLASLRLGTLTTLRIIPQP